MATSLLIRHGRAWRNDAIYRWLWLLTPIMLTVFFTIWIFQDPAAPAASAGSGIWWKSLDEKSFKLMALFTQAANDPAAAAELKARASAGDPLAEYYMGCSLDPDFDPAHATDARTREGMDWLKRSADAGNADAAANYGHLRANQEGDSLPPDYPEAVKYLQLAGNKGLALRELAILYYSGNGVAPDEQRGNNLMQQATDAYDWEAPNLLGIDYDKGLHGQPVDKAKAVSYFRRAASLGRAPAERELGLHLYFGDGVEKNNTEGVYWLKTAASGGDEVAQQFLQDNKLN